MLRTDSQMFSGFFQSMWRLVGLVEFRRDGWWTSLSHCKVMMKYTVL